MKIACTCIERAAMKMSEPRQVSTAANVGIEGIIRKNILCGGPRASCCVASKGRMHICVSDGPAEPPVRHETAGGEGFDDVADGEGSEDAAVDEDSEDDASGEEGSESAVDKGAPAADVAAEGAPDGAADGAADGATEIIAIDAAPSDKDTFLDREEGDDKLLSAERAKNAQLQTEVDGLKQQVSSLRGHKAKCASLLINCFEARRDVLSKLMMMHEKKTESMFEEHKRRLLQDMHPDTVNQLNLGINIAHWPRYVANMVHMNKLFEH